MNDHAQPFRQGRGASPRSRPPRAWRALLRPRLRVRLLVSYVVVVLVGGVTLLITVAHVAPDAFDAAMGHAMGARMVGISDATSEAVSNAFGDALTTSLTIAMAVAALVSILVSLALAGRIMRPVERLIAAGSRIAAGRYAERVDPDPSDEIAALAASFNQMADALETTERRRVQLVGDVAHELRTPLMTLEGFVEGLEDGVFPPDARTWGRLHDETTRLATLVDELQDLWRAESGQAPLVISAVDAAGSVRSVAERFAGVAAERGVELRPELAPTALPVAADEDRLGQVLDNLVSNAIRHSPAGGQVRLRIRADEGDIVFSVADDGPGLTDEQCIRVFDRFYRVDASRSRALGGFGVGLAISRALAEAMGGRLWAESDGPGHGSTFLLALPAA